MSGCALEGGSCHRVTINVRLHGFIGHAIYSVLAHPRILNIPKVKLQLGVITQTGRFSDVLLQLRTHMSK